MVTSESPSAPISARCPVCGGTGRVRDPVLWPELIAQWRLSPEEAEVIDRREGIHCTTCRSNLRSMALARALVSLFHGSGTLAETMSPSPDVFLPVPRRFAGRLGRLSADEW